MELDLQQFNNACEELVTGKYILANIKVKALIKSINNSERLTEMVSSSIDGFDFNIVFRESLTPNGIVLPKGDKMVIAYGFNLLYNLDTGVITFLDFLTKYFSSSKLSAGEEFNAFISTIIQPFKVAINNEYNRLFTPSAEELQQSSLYHKLIGVATANIKDIDEFRLKQIEQEELQLLLNAIIEASKKNNKELLYATMVGLDYFTKYNKRAKEVYLQLKDCFTRN